MGLFAGPPTPFEGLHGLFDDSLPDGWGRLLLDREMDQPVVAEIRDAIETGAAEGATRITDLHVWRVGKGQYASIVSLSVDSAVEPDFFRRQIGVHEELVHITVEVNQRERP